MIYDPFREPYAAAMLIVLLDSERLRGCAFARDGASSALVFNGHRNGRPLLSVVYGNVEVIHARPQHRGSPRRGPR